MPRAKVIFKSKETPLYVKLSRVLYDIETKCTFHIELGSTLVVSDFVEKVETLYPLAILV